MTTAYRDRKAGMAICQKCGHDLMVRKHSDGYVYCSNARCAHHKKAHPTRREVNAWARSQ